MNWPVSMVSPLPNIHLMSEVALGLTLLNARLSNATNGMLRNIASGVYPAANLAILVPLRVPKRITIKRVFWYNGATVNGNVDIGVYDRTFTRIASLGSTAQATINVVQSADITDFSFGPGHFYMAIASSSATATFFSYTPSTAQSAGGFGMAEMATAFALPATITPAVFGRTLIPMFGLSQQALV